MQKENKKRSKKWKKTLKQVFSIKVIKNVKQRFSTSRPYILSHASSNTTSRNIGRTDTWAVPHLKFWEGPSPLSFRPWVLHIANKFNDRHNSGDNESWRL